MAKLISTLFTSRLNQSAQSLIHFKFKQFKQHIFIFFVNRFEIHDGEKIFFVFFFLKPLKTEFHAKTLRKQAFGNPSVLSRNNKNALSFLLSSSKP